MSLRVVIAVTHLLGVGHLARAAALARAFARAGHETALVSGGMPAPLVRTDCVGLVQLPPVRTIGTDFRTLLDENGVPVTPARLEARRDMILNLVEDIRPDAIVTELFPFGRRALAGEFMTLVETARTTRPDGLILASIRDILVTPAKADRIAATHETLREFYDAILVHGDPRLVPLDASWPIDETTRALIRYTGYVDDGAEVPPPSPRAASEIVVSGGGSAASLPLFRAAIGAAELVPEPWRILVGTGVTEDDYSALRRAAPSNVTLERARPDFRALLAGSAVSVSQAGYNTIVDVLRTGARAVLVPFEQGNESEQRLRAERLRALGAAEVIPEADLSPEVLAGQVRAALRRPSTPRTPIDLGGAERTVAIVEELAATKSRSSLLPGRGNASSGWDALEAALKRAAERNATLRFWWRDDDAVARTQQLDRLLALAVRFQCPIAIAAIPARIEASLPARLAKAPLVRVLVHGLVHANHAPRGAKKAEFGPHRPVAKLSDDAAEAIRMARDCLGGLMLPVFVPPWNRIGPELIERLPDLGYLAVSAYGERRTREPAPGLLQINTHVDPIAWHAGRSLVDTEVLLGKLAKAIEARAEAADPEPIGLLTHHLVHDEAVWRFCEQLLSRLAHDPAIRFAEPDEMFASAHSFAN